MSKVQLKEGQTEGQKVVHELSDALLVYYGAFPPPPACLCFFSLFFHSCGGVGCSGPGTLPSTRPPLTSLFLSRHQGRSRSANAAEGVCGLGWGWGGRCSNTCLSRVSYVFSNCNKQLHLAHFLDVLITVIVDVGACSHIRFPYESSS